MSLAVEAELLRDQKLDCLRPMKAIDLQSLASGEGFKSKSRLKKQDLVEALVRHYCGDLSVFCTCITIQRMQSYFVKYRHISHSLETSRNPLT